MEAFRTYIVRVKIPSGIFWYAGQRKLSRLDMSKDSHYRGSGVKIQRLQSLYGKECFHIKWLSYHYSREKSNKHEEYLISKLKEKHGKNCLNISNQGHYTSYNKATASKTQKIVQNRPERKKRQSEVMQEFYAKGGNKLVSEGVKRKQRSGVWWKNPLKAEIYCIWKNSKTKAMKEVIEQVNKTNPEITSSQLKNLLYEFRDKGYVEPYPEDREVTS